MNDSSRLSRTLIRKVLFPVLGLTASAVWFACLIADRSISHGNSLGLDVVRILAGIALSILGALAASGARRLHGTRHVLCFMSIVWLSTVTVSFAVHRSAESTVEDLIVSIFSFGLWPGSTDVTGLQGGPFLLAIVIMTIIPSRLRIIVMSKSGHVEQESNPRIGGSAPIDPAPLLGISAISIVAFAPSLFDLLARQHVDRIFVDEVTGSVSLLLGPLLPTYIWAVIASGLLGNLFFLPFLFLRRATGSGVSTPRDSLDDRSSESRSRLNRLTYLWVVALAFWVRLVTLLTVAPTRTDGGDPLFYHVTANLLAQGRGLPEPLNFIAFQRWIPSALHGPAYPIVLSISSRLGGTTYFDHKFMSVLIGTLVVAATIRIAHLIAPPRFRTPSAVIAGLLSAIYPNLWLVDGVLFPEGLMALFILGVIFCAYKWIRHPSYVWMITLGALISASALTRGEGLLLSVLLVVPMTLLARQLPFRTRLIHLTAAGLACVIVLAPWSIRNARSFEAFVPLSTNGNELFVYANCPPVYEGKFLGFWLFQCQEDLRADFGEPDGDEAQKSLYWRRIGVDYARENAQDLPRVLAARIARQWDLFRPWQNTDFAPIEGRNKDAARIGLFMYYVMLPAAAVGAVLLRRARVKLLPLGAVFASVTVTAAYAYGTTRFRVPAEPLLCLLAGIGVASIVTRVQARWSPSLTNASFNLFGSRPKRLSFVEGEDIDVRKAFHPSSRGSWISFGLVGLAIAVALPALFRSVGSSMEEGFMLVFPELVMKGLVPNVDFLHLYGPGSLYALATWFELFGVSLVSERTFGLIQHLMFVTGMMLLVRPWGRIASTLIGLGSLLFVLTPVGLQALAWNGALGFGVWSVLLSLRARNRQSPFVWMLAGAFAGFALTFRPDVGLALGLAALYVLWRQTQRSWFFHLGGLAIGLGPMWWHLVQAGPRAVIDGIFIDPVVRLRAGRELPRPPSLDRLDGALQVISEKFAPWWSFPHLSAPQQLFIWFFLLPTIAISVLVIAHSMKTFRSERKILVAVSLFGVGLLPQAFQRPDSAHFLWVSAVTWPLMIIAILELLRRKSPNHHPRALLAIAASSFVILIVLIVPFYTARTYADLVVRSISSQTDVREVRRADRVFYLGDERPWRATLAVVNDLDSLARPGDKLFVGPVDLRQTAYSDAFFYHLFPELRPSTYFIEMDPGIANQDPRLADDVRSADWLILTRFWSGWIEPNASVVFGSDLPNQVVEDSFCLVESYQHDLVRLFQRCPIGDGLGPYEGPYEPKHDYAVEVLVPVPPRPDGTCTPTCYGRPSMSGIEIGIDTSVIE